MALVAGNLVKAVDATHIDNAAPQTHIANFATVSDPPTQAEVNAIVSKLNTLLSELEAAKVLASS